MGYRKHLLKIAAATLTLLPYLTVAQSSSINTYSPYTFYGIGDMQVQGPSMLRNMGGSGYGVRNGYSNFLTINYLNPASYSATARSSFLFNFGLEGQNFYERQREATAQALRKTSFNTVNFNEVAFQMPLGKDVGFALNVTPFSNVGYRVERTEDDSDILADIGHVKYIYQGTGGVTQVSAGVGWAPAKWISLGAEATYYWGSITRSYTTAITMITGTGVYSNTTASDKDNVAKVLGNFGLQVIPVDNARNKVIIGGVYRMGGKFGLHRTRNISGNSVTLDSVVYSSVTTDFQLPQSIGGGVSLYRRTWNINADYTYQDWSRNGYDEKNRFRYVDTHTVKIGGQYTPNAGDVRHFLNRVSYRAGVRYGNYFGEINGEKIDEVAFSLGVGIPFKFLGTSAVNAGVELGQRGRLNAGLIRERYFKFTIGLSLFGEDYWFTKRKYD